MFIAYFSINEGCYKSGEGYWLIGSGVELEFNVEVLFIHPILIKLQYCESNQLYNKTAESL